MTCGRWKAGGAGAGRVNKDTKWEADASAAGAGVEDDGAEETTAAGGEGVRWEVAIDVLPSRQAQEAMAQQETIQCGTSRVWMGKWR